jgi:glyoxylase-like metal-dependent hydrolase (beta-lactamase superfamily II)
MSSGSSPFPGGPDKTNSPADFASLMDDLEERVFGQLPDETWVYPGHGDDTTLGAERPSLPEWRTRGW